MKLLTVLVLAAAISMGFSSSVYADHRPLYKPGHVVHVSPAHRRVVKVRGIPYYVYNRNFYRRYHNYFIIVPTPIGKIVKVFPGGYVTYRSRLTH